ncbi:MAG: hypothetical protein V3R69_06260 [candidate division NC10 bacterium]
MREICAALERDREFDFDTVRQKLSLYPSEPNDPERLKDEFSNLDASGTAAFLVTWITLKS